MRWLKVILVSSKTDRDTSSCVPRCEGFVPSRSLFAGLMLATAFSVGCGGGSKPKPAETKVVPAPVTVANPNPAPANVAKANVDTKPKTGKPTGTPKEPLLPGTDPKSVFEISALNTPMEVSPPASRKEDEFSVTAGNRGIDSSRLVIAAVEPTSKGKPRQGFNLPAGFTPIADGGYSDDGLPRRIKCNKTGSTLVLVPAGIATIGTNEGPAETQPEITVHLDTFYIEAFEVTVEQFEAYRQDLKDKKKPLPTTANPTAPPKTPVLGVTLTMAQQYARWAAMDLPTESEFEKAARGPNRLRTPWGNGRAVWPNKRTPETLTAVGAYSSDMSPYGAYDLAGNAKEWCSDLYLDSHKDAAGPNGQVPHNWQGPKKVPNGNMRVVKGNGPDWSAWHREGRDVGKGHPDVGFRCVLRIVSPQPTAGT
ncbi:MAG: formylglycine-generating enzyme family protein [Planctomycetaceae bacterium]